MLQTMVSGYNHQERASIIQFQGYTVRVSFKPEDQHGGLQAQWKSTRVKFTPPKLSSAHLVPQEALTVASPVGDVRPVGVLFRKINEGEPPAQWRVSLLQINLAVLASECTDDTSMADQAMAEEVIPGKNEVPVQGIGTSTTGSGTGTTSTSTIPT